MNNAFWRVTLLAGLLASGLLACAKTPAAQRPERAALEAAILRWTAAVNAQDVATLGTTMTDDVELSVDATTATGRDAAIRALRELASRGRLIVTTREITLANGMAWHVVGLTQVQGNGDVHASGQALEIWKLVDGEWQLHRRMAAAIAPGISVSRPSTKEPVLDRAKD